MAIPTFPVLAGLTWPVKRSPRWSTAMTESVSGKVDGAERWSYPKWGIELSYDLLRSDVVNAEWQQLVGFFNGVRGRGRVFDFADPDDGAVTDQLFGNGDGVTTRFQLVRSLGGFTEPVFRPTGDIEIKVAAVAKASPADYSINASGLVTFTVAPAADAQLTWTGAYNWLCRLDDDSATFEKFTSSFWSLGSIRFTTEKP